MQMSVAGNGRFVFLPGFVLLVVLVFQATAVFARDFTFTAIPDQDQNLLKERFTKFAVYLEKALGVKVKYVPVKSYPSALSAFHSNQVQLAWFGGLTGVQARRLVPGSVAIAQGVEDKAFKSYFIAHRSAELRLSADFPIGIRGKSFIFGAKNSTSGRLMPEFYIRQFMQAAPETVFSSVGFSGDHSRTIALVESGAYQVGSLNYIVWDEALAQGQIDISKVNIIWTSPAYPDYHWTVRGDVDEVYGAGFKQKLTDAFLSMKDPALLRPFLRSGFIPASNEDYLPIEETALSIGILDDY
jgi:phosphonate transport system substrate-binding protein